MRIKQVRIKNFRTLQDVTINVEHDVTTFIGPNGSGKSTFLYALDWFFMPLVVIAYVATTALLPMFKNR